MAWTDVSITFNTDDPTTGFVVAIWNKGQADQFIFTGRGKTSQIPAFVTAAKAAQAAAAVTLTNKTTIESSILTQLNT